MVETISNVLVMEIGWTDVGSGGYILVSCAHSNTSLHQVLVFLLSYNIDSLYLVHMLVMEAICHLTLSSFSLSTEFVTFTCHVFMFRSISLLPYNLGAVVVGIVW